MANENTIHLLDECHSGVQMAVFSLEDISRDVKDSNFKRVISESILNHKKLGDETYTQLLKTGHEAKDPNPLTKGMSWAKSNAKMMLNDNDKTCADLITEGCNMGIKSLYRYINEYKDAEQDAKKLAEDIIREEETLRQNISCYL